MKRDEVANLWRTWITRTLTKTRTNGGNSLREEQPRARASLVKWHWLGLGEEEGCQFIVGALVPAGGSSRY